MTRLSLHPDSENPNLAIHLREGQYCTVGSSAAADYSIRADGIEPLHCRIGCQASGGYIECFDAFDSITVNDIRKGRSRLSHGDRLRIGTVELRVELPNLESRIPNFAVQFESEDTPTTKVADEFGLQSPPRFIRGLKPGSSDSRKSDSPPVSGIVTDSLSDKDPVPDSKSAVEATASVRPPAPPTESNDDDTSRSSARLPELTTPRSLPDSKPQFEFDSAEPADLEMSHSEFAELSNPDSRPVGMEGVDLESGLAASVPSRSTAAANTGSPGSDEDESEQAFPGGTFLGKYWRWNGQQAITALQHLIEWQRDASVYRSEPNHIHVQRFEEISLSRLIQLQPAVFLISRLELRELQQLVRQKRWEDRIGHPQAVTMFLTFLPRRILNEFFDAIDSCVLIHENEVEFLRLRKTL